MEQFSTQPGNQVYYPPQVKFFWRVLNYLFISSENIVSWVVKFERTLIIACKIATMCFQVSKTSKFPEKMGLL